MATSGIIAVTAIPGWPTPLAGIMENLENVTSAVLSPNGLHVADLTIAQSFLNGYAGGAIELQWNQNKMQAALDALLDQHFDLKAFIRAGTSTGVTAANVGTFLAAINNNYRSLRAAIATSTTLVQLQAININAGWPSNP